MTGAPSPRRAIFFTQQSVGLGARKTSLIFLAEALARRGTQVSVVTVQLSQISRLRAGGRLASIPASQRNRWYDHGALRGYVWVPPIHPARLPRPLLDRLTAPLVRRYGALLPAAIRAVAKESDVVVIESCAAVALFGTLRRLAPQARFIYSMSDRLDVVGMHPALNHILQDDAADYALIRVPAAAMTADFDARAHVRLIPHGLDRATFDAISDRCPRADPRTAVLAGDMMLDQAALRAIGEAFPNLIVNYFGRTPLTREMPTNVVHHGEVAFQALAPIIKHADVGLALYRPMEGLDYLGQSSLKMLQYGYCRLPIVAPDFVTAGLANAHGYDPSLPESAAVAVGQALAAGRTLAQDVPIVRTWDEVIVEMLDQARSRTSEVTPVSAPTRLHAVAAAADDRRSPS